LIDFHSCSFFNGAAQKVSLPAAASSKRNLCKRHFAGLWSAEHRLGLVESHSLYAETVPGAPVLQRYSKGLNRFFGLGSWTSLFKDHPRMVLTCQTNVLI
jgi:hypothetical protein